MSALRCIANPNFSFFSGTSFAERSRGRHVCVSVTAKKQQPGSELANLPRESSSKSIQNGVVFQPFEEVQSNIAHVSSTAPNHSLARQYYSPPCEAAVNELINVEYNVSYIYHDLYAYFDRDVVALPGLAKYFKEGSDSEKGDAQRLIDFQDRRGGRVKLKSIMHPEVKIDDEKGDALYAMELALSLQKLTYEKLLYLSKVSEDENDPQMQDFVHGTLLPLQVDLVKKLSDYVAQLRRVGKGYGVYHFDLQLQAEG